MKKIMIFNLSVLLIAGCASNDPYRDNTKTENVVTDAAIGTAIGAGIGALSGHKHRGRNAAIGAGIGAALGAGTGALRTDREY